MLSYIFTFNPNESALRRLTEGVKMAQSVKADHQARVPELQLWNTQWKGENPSSTSCPLPSTFTM